MALNENLSRREFLSGTGALALAPVALSKLELPAAFVGAAQPAAIIRRKLGRTDIEIPIIGMGVLYADNPAIIQESYKIGVRFFDTADAYQNGRNEEMVGRVIEKLNIRSQVIIQTKTHPILLKESTAAERTRSLLEKLDESLVRLNMDYVDIYQLHAPATDHMTDSGIKEALAEMKKQKKARYIGFAAHMQQAEQLNVAAKEGIYDTAAISFNFTMADNRELLDAIKNAANAGIGLIAMKTQAGGRPPNPKPGAKPVSWSQTAALKWVLNHTEFTAAIPGYANFDHMKEDFSVAFGLDYTDVEKKFLSERNLQASVQFCRQCEACRQTCPNGVDIPALMRTHMYAARYGNLVHARETLDEIAANDGLKNCAGCSGCNANCANYVGIADNIRDLKSMYLRL